VRIANRVLRNRLGRWLVPETQQSTELQEAPSHQGGFCFAVLAHLAVSKKLPATLAEAKRDVLVFFLWDHNGSIYLFFYLLL